MNNTFYFCMTSDLDWASEFCIRDFLSLLQQYGVKPTLFVTHKSPFVTQLVQQNLVDVGIHPNFLPGTTQGSTPTEIIDTLLTLYPYARTFRSHCFFDSTLLIREMKKRGFTYDSNLCLYLQSFITPLYLGADIVRFPVFWEDDTHWIHSPDTWNFSDFVSQFTSSGIKVLNFHPFLVAVNAPSQAYYDSVKKHITTLSEETIAEVRYQGKGVRTFLIEFLEFARSHSIQFHTLHELSLLFPLRHPSLL